MFQDISLFDAHGRREPVRRRTFQYADTARVAEFYEMPPRAEPDDSCRANG